MTPVRMVTANLDFATGPRRDRRYLRELAGIPQHRARRWLARPDTVPPRVVLFTQEAKTGRVWRLLGGLFHGLQGKGEAKAGTSLHAYGIRLSRLRLWLTGDSGATLPRWATEGTVNIDGQRVLCVSVHIFPGRSGNRNQLDQLARVRRRLAAAEAHGHPWIVGLDANRPMRETATLLGGVNYHRGITGFVCHRNVLVSEHGSSGWGEDRGITDHPSHHIVVAGVDPVL